MIDIFRPPACGRVEISVKQFTTSTEALTPPSFPSSSNPHGDSLHPPPPLPTLPFELVVEILCRLPVKSLLQFRCVCKSWNSLISGDPKFARKHLRCSPKDFTRHHLIFGSTNEFLFTSSPLLSVFDDAAAIAPSTQFDHPLNNPNPSDFIVGSCDGIVCLAIDGRFPLLWNPSTGRFKDLPSLENPRLPDMYTVFGFGYNHFADCYKVVALFCH
ncbi:putative F-box protein At3g16210 [Lotus japonicus]|uniref:putative F-box protein At3g16210 n=1 Tax=Lotus japonicus TaxID=34305 RepID=UPI002586F91A|nr:putative F-box protein At3g16210 [Lotus japonicus]